MVPARNLLRRHCDNYGGFFSDNHPDFYQEKTSIRSSLMAEEHSRAGGDGDEGQRVGGGQQEEVGTSSKEGDERYDGWLQLGLGGGISAPSLASSSMSGDGQERERPTELDLFPDRSARRAAPLAAACIPPGSAVMMPRFPAAGLGGLGYRRDVPWEYWNSRAVVGSSSSVAPPPVLQYNYRHLSYPPGGLGPSVGEGGSRGGDVLVVSPPRRPQVGVWFVLQAAQNQARVPILPQIQKSFLRIKDGRMTVRLLMKYLVNKLGLDNESEVEITCRGQHLHPLLTLQHVRDSIWCSREAAAVALILSDSPSADHVMMLNYSRST